MRQYEILLIQIIIGIFLGLVLVKLYQTKRSISYEKRLGKFGINSVKDNELSFFDQVHLFLYGLIKSISKFLTKFKYFNKKSIKYAKYIKYSDKDQIEPIDYISMKFMVLIAALIISTLFSIFSYNNLNITLFLLSLMLYYVLDIYWSIEYKHRKSVIEDELLKAIMIMNNAFRSGKSIVQALEIVINELNGPIEDEFKKILIDIRYGLSFDVAFNRFYKRLNIDDARYITTSLVLLNRTGGNIVNVFNNVERTIVNRKKMKDELNSLTSASKFMFNILVLIPILMVLIILMLNNNYFKPFISDPFGILVLLIIVFLYIGYIIVIKKVLDVDIK